MNNTQKETAIQNERQLNKEKSTEILLNIESHLKSISESLYRIAYCHVVNSGTFVMGSPND